MLKGGKDGGDWDDFDFILEAVPVAERTDPGPGTSEFGGQGGGSAVRACGLRCR